VGAHPLGNFSISQYSGIRVTSDAIEVRYLVDMAEIPTFQEIQDTGIVPDRGHPSLAPYLARRVERLRDGLLVEVDGRRLPLQTGYSEVLFPPGAGGLPTLKLGTVFRVSLPDPRSAEPSELRYRDGNFTDRAGWKEIIAVPARGVTFLRSSVPEKDRSQELADYPTDLLNSPPRDLEARIIFTREGGPLAVAGAQPESPSARGTAAGSRPSSSGASAEAPGDRQGSNAPPKESGTEPALGLRANKQATPRSTFTDLMTRQEFGFQFVAIALVVATGLGAFHALEPGHGKTVVAAYLVGSRGTPWHAVWLGLIVTGSHTAGVYLLGAVTLYASHYVVPERLYPWLGVASGLTIAGLGFVLFLRRYAGGAAPHGHAHALGHGHAHDHDASHDHGHAHGTNAHSHDASEAAEHAAHAGHHHHHHPETAGTVTGPALVALGITGGIVPCPAALVVLLSAVSLNRVGFGLLLIMAFSVGLAAVLIAIGMLMVYARRFMGRFQGDGAMINRWLPLTSSAIITLLGVGIAVQALVTAGVLQIRL
jgi:ABC-type nickel/cobalt efflux system permease component RcnA